MAADAPGRWPALWAALILVAALAPSAAGQPARAQSDESRAAVACAGGSSPNDHVASTTVLRAARRGGTKYAPLDVGDPLPLHVAINVPAFRLDAVTADSVISYRVAVGQPRYPTPRRAFAITEITWNPWWVPPPSDWARRDKVTPPGPRNPMGRVKLRIAPLVFIHGSPYESSLGSAASHGCLRMANADAIALARMVHRAATPELPDAVLDSLIADTARTRTFALPLAVPLVIRYELAEVRNGTMWVYPDVYQVASADPRAHALRALAAHGVAAADVDLRALDALLRRARSQPASTSVGSLLRTQTNEDQPDPRERGRERGTAPHDD